MLKIRDPVSIILYMSGTARRRVPEGGADMDKVQCGTCKRMLENGVWTHEPVELEEAGMRTVCPTCLHDENFGLESFHRIIGMPSTYSVAR